jgi:serine/threonine-protein kinase
MDVPHAIGKYEVQGLLGKGATGLVLRGFDPAIKRAVALKVIDKAALDPADADYIVSRFRHEAEAVGRLTHPGIAAIYDFIEQGDLACIVMELVKGKSLAHHLRDVKQYDFKDAWEIIRQMLEGLSYSHGQGVIHRDLKPANVLINDDGRIKITDFGVARLDTSTLTVVGDVVGTPHYMAPEQFGGKASTPQTDIYQVGVMLYELTTGTRPFNGNNVEILRRVLNEAPQKPSEHNPKIPPALDAAILKALAKHPEERYASARDFIDALAVAFAECLPPPSGALPNAASLLTKARMLAGARDTATGGEAAAPAAVSQTFALGDARKARVLFVDDEERILNALRTLFRGQYHVFTAENGSLALEFVKRFGIHVVVSDQRMPNMVGVELLRQVKEVSPNSVRMLLTGYSDLAAIVGSINEGEVFRFVRKPWDNEDMQRTIADAVAIALELANAPPVAAALPEKIDASILVIDTSAALIDGLKSVLGGVAPVRLVNSAEDAVRTLESEEIALIIADLSVGQEGLVTLFKLLKEEHPEILSILVTETSDSELVIDLINQAQIYRFLNKPIHIGQLRSHVQSALKKYVAFRMQPGLTHQHKVAQSVSARSSAWGAKLLDRIRTIPNRLFSRG